MGETKVKLDDIRMNLNIKKTHFLFLFLYFTFFVVLYNDLLYYTIFLWIKKNFNIICTDSTSEAYVSYHEKCEWNVNKISIMLIILKGFVFYFVCLKH